MKVGELISELYTHDQNAEVLLSSDAEGNEIRPFDGEPYCCAYSPATNEIYDFEHEQAQAQEAPLSAIVLYPVDR